MPSRNQKVSPGRLTSPLKAVARSKGRRSVPLPEAVPFGAIYILAAFNGGVSEITVLAARNNTHEKGDVATTSYVITNRQVSPEYPVGHVLSFEDK